MNPKDIFKEWRVWLLLVSLFCATLAIGFTLDTKGVLISAVDDNSSAALAGMQANDERIVAINNQDIANIDDYRSVIQTNEETLRITTEHQTYTILDPENLGIDVKEIPKSNLQKGLELQGGTRVLLQPAEVITQQELDDTIDVLEKRLNVYGLSDVKIRKAADLLDNDYILVEIAGVSKEEVKRLLANQGKFEAKIGDTVVFRGGQEDITFVCRNDGTCSRISNCYTQEGQSACQFEFEISLSTEAANRHAETTKDLKINITQAGSRILELPIEFFVDGVNVDSLNIAADLKGQQATRITISGPGYGVTQQDAVDAAIQQRTNLQTILITGSLKTPLDIVKLDYISPSLGKEFLDNAIFVAIAALLAVGIVIFIRYRSLPLSLTMMFIVACEVYLILGLAALFRYNLDLAAIAGIIASVGTGVDDQIVITDEVREGGSEGSWKQRLKKAFFIILIAYATTVAAMLPLLKAGAGLLTGFALVTIAGVTIGVLVTRPAFAAVIKVLLKE